MTQVLSPSKGQISKSITQLVHSGKEELDIDHIQLIKSFCKSNPIDGVQHVYKGIMRQLTKPHAQVRYACVQIADELFRRSAEWRRLFLRDHRQWLDCCIPSPSLLPPPSDWSEKMVTLFIKVTGEWYEKFRSVLNEIVAFHAHVQALVPAHQSFVRESNTRVEEHDTSAPTNTSSGAFSHDERISAFRTQKYNKLVLEWDQESKELQDTLRETQSIVHILVPDFQSLPDDNTVALPPHINLNSLSSLKAIGIPTSSYRLQITVPTLEESIPKTEDNAILFDALSEAVSVLKKQHLPWLNKCLKLISVVHDPDRAQQSDFLKKVIDMKQRVLHLCEQAQDLLRDIDDKKVQDEDDEEDEDEEFEDVAPIVHADEEENESTASIEKESHEQHAHATSKVDDSALKEEIGPAFEIIHFKDPAIDELDENEVKKLIQAEPNPERRKLLETAPIVPYGEDLYYWDKSNVTFSEISAHGGIEYHHRFLGERQDDHVVSKETLDELRKRPVIIKTKRPIDIRPCRAPLPSGKLCSRRDLVRCPFHGPIIPRDEFGIPLIESNETVESAKNAEQSSSVINSTGPVRRVQPSSSTQDQIPTWMAIESQVMSAHDLPDPRETRRGRSASGIIPTTSVKNPRQKRLLKRVKALSRASLQAGAGAHLEDAEMNSRMRDKQTYRW